jgi:hypothetical protein
MMKRNNAQARDAAVEIRLSAEEAAELDAWIAEQNDGMTRVDAIKLLVQRGIEIDRAWEDAKRAALPDEGMRPDELTADNDG